MQTNMSQLNLERKKKGETKKPLIVGCFIRSYKRVYNGASTIPQAFIDAKTSRFQKGDILCFAMAILLDVKRLAKVVNDRRWEL